MIKYELYLKIDKQGNNVKTKLFPTFLMVASILVGLQSSSLYADFAGAARAGKHIPPSGDIGITRLRGDHRAEPGPAPDDAADRAGCSPRGTHRLHQAGYALCPTVD